jgi:hypothetical protein
MLRSLAVGLSLLGFVDGLRADPPTARIVPASVPSQIVRADGAPVVVKPAPVVVNAAPTAIAAQPCPCEKAARPGRVWLSGWRPVVTDDPFRYEPRIRDIRFAPQSSTLPGAGLGAPDTLFVLPPSYHPGYFRVFDRR